MKQQLKTIAIAAGAALIGATVVAIAAQTNYLGTVFIADTTTPTHQLTVNSDGSINVDVTAGGGGGTVVQGNAGTNAQAWWTRVGDATTGPVAVKAAGSPATASDIGLATALRTYASAGTQQNALAVTTNTQLTVPAGTTCGQITVETANVRRTSDGTSATTTNGTLIPAGSSWGDCGPLAAYKFTAVSGSPTLDFEPFK